jgi:hypothetical protein
MMLARYPEVSRTSANIIDALEKIAEHRKALGLIRQSPGSKPKPKSKVIEFAVVEGRVEPLPTMVPVKPIEPVLGTGAPYKPDGEDWDDEDWDRWNETDPKAVEEREYMREELSDLIRRGGYPRPNSGARLTPRDVADALYEWAEWPVGKLKALRDILDGMIDEEGTTEANDNATAPVEQVAATQH